MTTAHQPLDVPCIRLHACGWRLRLPQLQQILRTIPRRLPMPATDSVHADAIRAESQQKSPLVGSIAPGEVLPLVVAQRGSVARGEQVFAMAGCVACHTVNATDPLKGPFLGNAAKMFPRRELAEAILDPGKSIAQGFVTNQFTLKDGSTALGFVTRESADVVSVRDITGQQRDIRVADVAKRDHLPTSLMPPGLMLGLTVRDFASLLDYLESLSATKN